MKLIIKGQIRGGKNNMNIDPRSGRHYPNREWTKWRDAAVAQVRWQMGSEKLIFIAPLTLFAMYTPSDRRRRDAPALLDSIFHVLERAMLVKDDSLFKQVHWIEREPNKTNAGIELSIVPFTTVP